MFYMTSLHWSFGKWLCILKSFSIRKQQVWEECRTIIPILDSKFDLITCMGFDLFTHKPLENSFKFWSNFCTWLVFFSLIWNNCFHIWTIDYFHSLTQWNCSFLKMWLEKTKTQQDALNVSTCLTNFRKTKKTHTKI